MKYVLLVYGLLLYPEGVWRGDFIGSDALEECRSEGTRIEADERELGNYSANFDCLIYTGSEEQ